MGIGISRYPIIEYLPRSEITYPSALIYAQVLPISPTLADRVLTCPDFIKSLQKETIQLKCTRILFSHLYTPFIVLYLPFILVALKLSVCYNTYLIPTTLIPVYWLHSVMYYLNK